MSDDNGLDPTAEMVLRIVRMEQADFDALVSTLNSADIPTSRAELEGLIVSAVPDGVSGENLTSFLLAFAGSFYWGEVDESYALTRLAEASASTAGVPASVIVDRVRKLVRARASLLVAGAQVGRRKTAGLVERLSLQMDLRPVIHPDGGRPELYSIYHRLQLVATDDDAGDEEKTIEVVLNHLDLMRLRDQAEALLQAQADVQVALRESGSTVFLPLRESE